MLGSMKFLATAMVAAAVGMFAVGCQSSGDGGKSDASAKHDMHDMHGHHTHDGTTTKDKDERKDD